MTFAYLTGWRGPSEVLSLQWRQVDFVAGVIRLEPGTTKNKDARVFPFDALGHKTESIYRRYAIVDEAMHREAAAKLNTYANDVKTRADAERKGQLVEFSH